MHVYDCPRCGKPQSAFGDGFCGPCEQEYAQSQALAEQEDRETAAKLARRCWIRHADGQHELVEYVDSASLYRLKIRRNGAIEEIDILWAEPAETNGGGLIVALKE